MADLISIAVMIISFIIFACYFYYIINLRSWRNYPPGPYPLPILGNILLLGPTPHRSLARLAETYGPLMHLKLGSVDAIIVSSSQVCEELLRKNDNVSSGRPQLAATQPLDHESLSIAWTTPDNHWRRVRKICREQMFSTSRLDATQGLRQEKLRKLRLFLDECCGGGTVVNINEAMFVTTLNLIWDTLFSLDFAEYNTDSSHEMLKAVRGLMTAWGLPNAGDFFPFLKWFDPQGIRKGAEGHMRKIFEIIDGIINRRLQSRKSSRLEIRRREDMLESLLDVHLRNPTEFSLDRIKHLLLDLVLGGSDTSALSVTWAMAELLRHPDELTRLQKELNTIITEKRPIQESDICKLPYLQAVVKETLRLHAPAVFLPRSNEQNDLKINGYDIPKNSRILVNLCALGQDSSVWSDPDSFSPERFVEQEIDMKGQDFRFVPFGSGRRMCLGMPLAHRMIHLMLASLVRDYDWKLEPGLEPQDIDMKEKFGLIVEKAEHLKAIPVRK